jgi:hypothetical protein
MTVDDAVPSDHPPAVNSSMTTFEEEKAHKSAPRYGRGVRKMTSS